MSYFSAGLQQLPHTRTSTKMESKYNFKKITVVPPYKVCCKHRKHGVKTFFPPAPSTEGYFAFLAWDRFVSVHRMAHTVLLQVQHVLPTVDSLSISLLKPTLVSEFFCCTLNLTS